MSDGTDQTLAACQNEKSTMLWLTVANAAILTVVGICSLYILFCSRYAPFKRYRRGRWTPGSNHAIQNDYIRVGGRRIPLRSVEEAENVENQTRLAAASSESILDMSTKGDADASSLPDSQDGEAPNPNTGAASVTEREELTSQVGYSCVDEILCQANKRKEREEAIGGVPVSSTRRQMSLESGFRINGPVDAAPTASKVQPGDVYATVDMTRKKSKKKLKEKAEDSDCDDIDSNNVLYASVHKPNKKKRVTESDSELMEVGHVKHKHRRKHRHHVGAVAPDGGYFVRYYSSQDMYMPSPADRHVVLDRQLIPVEHGLPENIYSKPRKEKKKKKKNRNQQYGLYYTVEPTDRLMPRLTAHEAALSDRQTRGISPSREQEIDFRSTPSSLRRGEPVQIPERHLAPPGPPDQIGKNDTDTTEDKGEESCKQQPEEEVKSPPTREAGEDATPRTRRTRRPKSDPGNYRVSLGSPIYANMFKK